MRTLWCRFSAREIVGAWVVLLMVSGCQFSTGEEASSPDTARILASGESAPTDNKVEGPSLAQAIPTDAVSTDSPDVNHQTYDLPNARVHVVWIAPDANVEVSLTVAEGLMTVTDQAIAAGAIAAINAGYFDPQNQQTTSFVISDGELVADPRENSRLIENPDLSAYLDQILNRSEFRQYDCADTSASPRFAIASYQDPIPSGCTLQSAVGGGPRLLPGLQSVEEGFLAYGAGGQVVRDAIGSLSPNARTAVGLKADGTLALVMVAQTGDRPGLSLPELVQFLNSLGMEEALNLDGGSSSSLFYRNTSYAGRIDSTGAPLYRPVKSVILVLP